MPRKPFQLLIKPVGPDCNLRCAYCFYHRVHEYYGGEQALHRMTDETLERLVSGLLELRFPESVFSWQGGEPTLAGLDFYKRAVAFQQKHGVPGQVVGNALQTNGLLIDEAWCRFLDEYQFLVGLSIDGPQELHDRYRFNTVGKGSWSRVMEAAQRMRESGVAFNVLCVVNRENVKLGDGLLRWFVSEGFPFVQFIPCVEPDCPHNVPPAEYGRFLCETFDYWCREGFGRVSVRDFDGFIAERAGGIGRVCTFGGRCDNYIVIEHTGDVYPCDFFVQPSWLLGNVMDSPLESFLETEQYRRFAYQKDKTPRCRGCQWRALCHGGCQKDRMLTGSLSEPSVMCEAYKIFFAHAVPRFGALARKAAQMNQRQS